MAFQAGVGHVDISVRSMWLLLAYASGLLDRLRSDDAAAIDAAAREGDLLDALVAVLVRDAERRLRHNLLPAARVRAEPLHRVRGRIDHLATARGRLLESGRIACIYTEPSVDRPRYRLLRSTLIRAAGLLGDTDVRRRAVAVARGLEQAGVSAAQVTRADLSREQFGRIDRADRDLVELCMLIDALAVPFHEAGRNRLPVIRRDETAFRALFEKATLGFLKHRYRAEWAVAAKKWQWPASGDSRLLPELRTDVTLDSRDGNRRIIVECKFTSLLATGSHGKTTVRSGYVQQLHAYLSTSPVRAVEGVLLGPTLDGQQDLDMRIELDGRPVRIMTIDLTGTPSAIRDAWASIVDDAAGLADATSAVSGQA